MKKILVLAAGLLQVPVIKKARQMGYYVVAADGNPNAEGLQYADKAIVADITSESEMLEHAVREQIDGVIHPCSEVSMNVMGYINDKLHLHGITREASIKSTNKGLMRQAFNDYGAPSPKSYCANNAYDGYKLYKQIHSNTILKPSRNSGSRGIYKIPSDTSFEDFAPFFERSKNESKDASVMIEQYVDGPEFSVEIIIWNHEVNVLQVTDKKTTGAPYFVELGHSQPSLFPYEIIEKVRNAAIQGVKALKLNDCAAHAEIKIESGIPYIMEIGARLGGDFISTVLTPMSTGIDMVAAAINICLGIEPNLMPVSHPYGVAIRYFTPNPGVVRYVNVGKSFCLSSIHSAVIYVKPGDFVNEITSSVDRAGHIIVYKNTVEEAIQEAESIVENVEIITSIE